MHTALAKHCSLFVIVAVGVALIVPVKTSAQNTDCSLVLGSHPATAADLTAMKAVGIPNPVIGMCWNPAAPVIGQAVGQAKIFLQEHATKNANISCLNADFAERIKNLMQAVPGGPPTITDGYRSPQQQANLPAGSTKVGPCDSYHQYGMAADFNNTNEKTLQWMRINASRFGLSPVTNANPVSGCTPRGFCDSGHIQIAGPKPPVNQCGMCTATGGNGILPAVRTPQYPDDSYNPDYRFIDTPSSPLINILRDLLSRAPAFLQPSPPPPPQYQQPLPQTQQPFDYTQTQPTQTLTYDPTTGTYTAATSGTTAGVSNGTSANNSPINILNTLARSSTNSSVNASEQASFLYANQNNTNGSTTGSGPSALEMIQQLAGYPTSTNGVVQATGTSGPATLNQNVQNVTNNTQRNQNVVATRTIATMSTSVPAYVSAQTFTSEDLQNSNMYSTYSPQQLSTFQKILAQLRNVLILILKYLQPFGGTVMRQNV